jgi:hypothetical protein
VSTLSIARGKRAQANGKLSPRVEYAKETAAQRAAEAREWAAKEYEAAKDWASPRLEAAVERTRDAARDDLAPKIAAALAAATAASEPVLDEAKHRSGLAVAALRGQDVVVVKKRRRWPRVFIFAFIGAAVAAIMSALQRKRFEDELSSHAVPVAGDLTSNTATPAADAAGASPAEAIADLVDEQPDREPAPQTPVAPVAEGRKD